MDIDPRNLRRSFQYPIMRICPTCHALFGECGKPTPQRCRCSRSTLDETWPGLDFNTLLELCRSCGGEILRSGSKWSVWFCTECKERAGRLNGYHGRYVIPVGRHSFHAGYMLDGEGARNPVEVYGFVQAMSSIREAMGVLRVWAGVAVALNLRAMGFDPENDIVGLIPYVEGVRRRILSKEERFGQLVQFFRDAKPGFAAPARSRDR